MGKPALTGGGSSTNARIATFFVALAILSGSDAGPIGTRAAAQEPTVLSISPTAGPPGTAVRLEAHGLPPSVGIVIAFGGLRAGYQWVKETETTEDGGLAAAAEVPTWAEEGVMHYFFLKFPGQTPLVTSDAFYVTDDAGTIRARGEITAEGDGWLTMRGADDEIYCLLGDVPGLESGDQARVRGTVAEPSSCPRGIPVQVETVERIGGGSR